MKKYGLVLAGGGTKGAYQLGALKALKELGIKTQAISGASIGALNAVMYIQNDLNKLEEMYKTAKATDFLKLENELKDTNLASSKNIISLSKEYIKQKGISNEPLANMLDNYVDLNKIYRSKIDLGIVMHAGNDSKFVFKKDIPKKQFKEYLLASSCFPIFKAQEIDNISYYDGGLSDNIPINMLLEKGLKDIIVIDIAGLGFTKRLLKNEANLTIISPNEDLGGTFEFDSDNISKNILIGYLDTMKKFNKLKGYQYYFKTKEYIKLIKKYEVIDLYNLEKIANYYKIDHHKVYKAKEFIKLILNKYAEEEKIYQELKIEKLNISYLKKLLSHNVLLALTMDIINNYPTLITNKTVISYLSENFKLSKTIMEIKNPKEISSCWF